MNGRLTLQLHRIAIVAPMIREKKAEYPETMTKKRGKNTSLVNSGINWIGTWCICFYCWWRVQIFWLVKRSPLYVELDLSIDIHFHWFDWIWLIFSLSSSLPLLPWLNKANSCKSRIVALLFVNGNLFFGIVWPSKWGLVFGWKLSSESNIKPR